MEQTAKLMEKKKSQAKFRKLTEYQLLEIQDD